MTAGQVSDYNDAAAPLGSLPSAERLYADPGYRPTKQHRPERAGRVIFFREALQDKGINICFPGWKSLGQAVRHEEDCCKRLNRDEFMFGRLKDWRCIARLYNRCAKTLPSAFALAATVLFWTCQSMRLEPATGKIIRSVQRIGLPLAVPERL